MAVTLDFIQPFSSPLIVNAFLKELDNNGITYDLQDVSVVEQGEPMAMFNLGCCYRDGTGVEKDLRDQGTVL